MDDCPEVSTRHIDLNADLGEGVTHDAALLRLVTSANVACGFHAGDESTMRRVCREAVRRGVAIGAQVSYADRDGFGRRHLDVAPDVLTCWVAEQVGMLSRIAAECDGEVAYLKPHGALYNRIVDDEDQARAVLEGSGDLPVLGLPGGVFLALAERAGRQTCAEGFPDRGYTCDGRLVPRSEPGALVEGIDAIVEHAAALAGAGAVASLCLHGDSPGAVEATRAVRGRLEADGWELTPRFRTLR